MKKVALLLVILLGFGYGLTQLFRVRFEAGDVYPPYSSFRTDPLGAKALYDSFDHLLRAERNFKPILGFENGKDTTLLLLALEPRQVRVNPAELKDLEQFVVTGGRLVLSFLPIYTGAEISAVGPSSSSNSPLPNLSPKAPRPKMRPPPSKSEEGEFGGLLTEQWKFGLEFAALELDTQKNFQPAVGVRVTGDDLPRFLPCRTALCFEKLNPAWRIIYRRTNDAAVLIERRLGSGSIVVAADSYAFSNEALLKERQSKLLAWVAGGAGTVIFDETHLGVQENHGIAFLARKYRLHGFAAGLLLLAGLFAWRYSVSFIPVQDLAETDEPVTGKEVAAGFSNLLRRNISSSALLSVCLEEWNKSCRHRVSVARLQKMQAIIDAQNALPERDSDPVAAYRQISQALARSSPRK